ncbi:MAG: LamG-like jellyroll fold domain-containing protein [Phycisphaerae bacterium]
MCKKLIYLVSFVLVLGLVLTSLAEAADPDLVGYWKFDETSGNIAFDSSGNGNDGTLNGDPQWAAGQLGGALELDGEGDYVDIGNDPIFNITDQITVACWIKVSQFTDSWQAIFTMGDDSWRLQRQTTTDNLCWACSGVTGTPGDWWLHGEVNVNDGEWHHTVGVYDGSKYYLYVDGDLDASKDASGTTNISSYPVLIGANAQQSGREFEGLIDDVRIYKRALNETEILGVMSGGGAEYPLASNPVPKDGVYHMDTWVNLSWRTGDFAVSHDVYFGDYFDDVSAGAQSTFQGNQTSTFLVAGFPGFAYPDGLVPGTTYYWRIDEVNEADPNSPWKGDVWSFSVPPKTAYAPDPADRAEQVDPDAKLSWTAGFDAKLHTVYFGDNFDEVNNADGGLPQGAATYSPGPLGIAKTYYWRVDEFDAVTTYKGGVWSFTTEGAVASLEPTNGAVDVKQTQIITWSPSVYAASHRLYFGTDKDAVKNADTGSPEYKGTRDLGAESYDPGMLEWDTTYYWRIDEVNNANPDSPWPGILWSFTTANFLVVDDFESYDDIDPLPGEPGINRIFDKWIDGYLNPTTNGALVGNDMPPYAETTIVHGGNQSMPYFYDNNLKTSEATLTLVYPRDWTEEGVTKLSLWFRGSSDNAAEQMYVALNDSAVVNHDNPDAAQKASWTEWNIDLQAFADQDVNLANVNSITLGLGNRNNPVAGGSGMMYFDDIRLYTPLP